MHVTGVQVGVLLVLFSCPQSELRTSIAKQTTHVPHVTNLCLVGTSTINTYVDCCVVGGGCNVRARGKINASMPHIGGPRSQWTRHGGQTPTAKALTCHWTKRHVSKASRSIAGVGGGAGWMRDADAINKGPIL